MCGPGVVRFFRWGTEACYLHQFPDLFFTTAGSSMTTGSGSGSGGSIVTTIKKPSRALCGNRPLDWRHSRVAVEFHVHSLPRYWTVVAPQLARLRDLYRSRNGSVVTACSVRTPADFLRSHYKHWPPCGHQQNVTYVVPTSM